MDKPKDHSQFSNNTVIVKHEKDQNPVPCDLLKGEYVDEVLFSSLEANLFSSAGCILWQTKTLHQKLQYEQKKRQHDHTGYGYFHRQMLDKLEERKRVLSEGLRDLARSMGASYENEAMSHETFEVTPIVGASGQDATLEKVDMAETEGYSSEVVAALPESDMLSFEEGLPNSHGKPLPKRARVEKEVEKCNAISDSNEPKSALARLVAQARAKERQKCDNFPASSTSETGKSHSKMVTFGGNVTVPETPSNPASEVYRVGAHIGVSNKTESTLDKEASDDEDFATPLPSAIMQLQSTKHTDLASNVPEGTSEAVEKHPSQMTREEFLSQYKRAPRRGEIGQDPDQIARAEELGYVMSGSQSKASQIYVDRIQRQLHEREAARLHQQFREVEDKLMDQKLIQSLLDIIHAKKNLSS